MKVKNPISPTRRPTDTPPPHYRCVGRRFTNATTDTLPTRRPTNYRRATDAPPTHLVRYKKKQWPTRWWDRILYLYPLPLPYSGNLLDSSFFKRALSTLDGWTFSVSIRFLSFFLKLPQSHNSCFRQCISLRSSFCFLYNRQRLHNDDNIAKINQNTIDNTIVQWSWAV